MCPLFYQMLLIQFRIFLKLAHTTKKVRKHKLLCSVTTHFWYIYLSLFLSVFTEREKCQTKCLKFPHLEPQMICKTNYGKLWSERNILKKKKKEVATNTLVEQPH